MTEIDVSRLDGGAFNVGQFPICPPEYRRFSAVDAPFSVAGAKA